jgi:hypothetical protein
MKKLFLVVSILFLTDVPNVPAQTKPVSLSSFDVRANALLTQMTLDEKSVR